MKKFKTIVTKFFQSKKNYNKENNMLSKEQITEFETLAKPLIKWLNDNTNPHASILIDCDSAQLNYGECIIHTEEFIND